MARPSHYSPALSRQMVSALYHGAKARKIPMTKFTDQLLRLGLMHIDQPPSSEPVKLETISTPANQVAQAA